MVSKILIVRSSSLGDLVHILPAISDIRRHLPDARIDWVAEQTFAEIPSWHPAIHQVIPIRHRKWRKSWLTRHTRRERVAFRQQLRATEYDIILDMQGLMKSVWVIRQARGLVRHGLDRHSAREPLASLFYDKKHSVGFWQPAVIRQRMLAAQTFGYEYSGDPDFGLAAFTDNVDIEDYAVVMPSASRDDKLWPEDDWQAVFQMLSDAGLRIRALAGNDTERERAEHMLRNFPGSEVLAQMSLTDVAHVLAQARFMIGLDSGLTHLSAALGRPTIGIYKASTPTRTPLTGSGFTASLGDRGVPPSRSAVLSQLEQGLQQA